MPRFNDLQQDSERADEQWQSADSVTAFDLAEKTYSNLQQRLGEWLEKEENLSEKSDRLQKSQSQASRIAEQLQQSQVRNSELASEIDNLKSQIAKQAELNQKDRLARESAEMQTKELMAKHTEAESDLNQLKATLQEKLRIESDLAKIQQQLADRNLEWENLQAQTAKLAKERDIAKDKVDRLEKLLASSGSSSSADLVKMSEQEILKIESIDTKDWDAADKALTEAKRKYREISNFRTKQLQDFSDTSPTIRKTDTELASQESVVRKALQIRDQADHEMFIELDSQLATKRAGRRDLLENAGRLATSAPVVEIDKQIATIVATQAKYIDGYKRSIGKQSVDVRAIIDEITKTKALRPGSLAGELLVIRVNEIDIRFHWCPAGSFTLGDNDAVRVTHSRGFWMMETECWQALWTKVMGLSKSSSWTQKFGVGDRYPAYEISHDEATQFARKLNQLLDAEGLIEGYEVRLPTEAQWEYAVRAGSTKKYCFGDNAKDLADYAWYGVNSGNKTQPVATKLPNIWGIQDGHGSLWEWCSDWYDEYPKGALTDPVGPSEGSKRVSRGGCFLLMGEEGLRSTFRNSHAPSLRDVMLGFRVALSPSGIPKSPETDNK